VIYVAVTSTNVSDSKSMGLQESDVTHSIVKVRVVIQCKYMNTQRTFPPSRGYKCPSHGCLLSSKWFGLGNPGGGEGGSDFRKTHVTDVKLKIAL
jgi:hypothetical protein